VDLDVPRAAANLAAPRLGGVAGKTSQIIPVRLTSLR